MRYRILHQPAYEGVYSGTPQYTYFPGGNTIQEAVEKAIQIRDAARPNWCSLTDMDDSVWPDREDWVHDWVQIDDTATGSMVIAWIYTLNDEVNGDYGVWVAQMSKEFELFFRNILSRP